MSENPADGPKDADPKELAFTTEEVSRQAEPKVKSIDEKREDTRSGMAIALMAGLGAVILGWVLVGIWGDSGDIAGANDALEKAFTGLLGLTGTVVGFYFGGGTSKQ